jgi:hypothetical protein
VVWLHPCGSHVCVCTRTPSKTHSQSVRHDDANLYGRCTVCLSLSERAARQQNLGPGGCAGHVNRCVCQWSNDIPLQPCKHPAVCPHTHHNEHTRNQSHAAAAAVASGSARRTASTLRFTASVCSPCPFITAAKAQRLCRPQAAAAPAL